MLEWLPTQAEPAVLQSQTVIAIGKGNAGNPSSFTASSITDDPLAAFSPHQGINRQIYSVSRINPLFHETAKFADRSSSSGYGDSVHSPKLMVDASNANTSSSGLCTIPEGATTTTTTVAARIPKPIWPSIGAAVTRRHFDVIADDDDDDDDVLVLPDTLDHSIKEVLADLLDGINTVHSTNSEQALLALVNRRLAHSLDALRSTTEEELHRLCVHLSNCRRLSAVLKAFLSQKVPSSSNSSLKDYVAAGITSKSSTTSSGFSEESPRQVPNIITDKSRQSGDNKLQTTPVLANSLALICQKNYNGKPSVWEQYYGVKAAAATPTTPTCATNLVQEKKSADGGKKPKMAKLTDVPIFPGGRPEADFTLDVPRSELLSKKMRQDKRWRCRCRLLTSFLGLVFFLLSVMAVSLMLTKGKRMFGSMM